MNFVDSGVQHRKWGGNTYPDREKEITVGNSKRKVKNLKVVKKLLSILDQQEPSVQSAEQDWSWGNMYLPKYGKWLSQHLAIYLKINSGFHASKNQKQ